MKKHTLLLLLTMIIAISFSACKDDESSPSTSNNIPESEFPATATGGDPRGTYTPNTPAASTKLPPSTAAYSFSMNYTKNTGSGTLKLEGTSATSGTYTNTNMKFDVVGEVKITAGGMSSSYPFPGDDPEAVDPFSGMPANGTWKVEGNTIFFDDDGEGIDFTVTSKGLFAVQTENIVFGTTTISIGMRKQ